MPQKPVYRQQTTKHTLPEGTDGRASYFVLHGMHAKPEWPVKSVENPLSLSYQNAIGCVAYYRFPPYPPASRWVNQDAPNMRSYYYAHQLAWDERLYAGVYSKFVSAARQGSAEWGMNIVQARKALASFIQLALTSATTVTAFCQLNRRGLEWLRKNPSATPASVKRRRRKRGRELIRAKTSAERRRLSNEIWTLDQVTKTLLAYRYGIGPLMTDLATTAELLSKEFRDDVTLRRAASKPWNGLNKAWDDKWTGTESVVLKATVSLSNPNLLLANRLGIINPQMWVWDLIPWSFVVDWWFPIGSFLQNFTALVGLSLNGASVTRTRAWSGTWIPTDPWNGGIYEPAGTMRFSGKRKMRETGSLPIPTSVPYGTGLGIQRGQNALALSAQKLKGR